MTITMLHQLAQNAAAEKFNADDYTEVMFRQFPQLLAVIGQRESLFP